jgi:hypothetical protein
MADWTDLLGLGSGLIKHGSGGNRLAHVSADALQGDIEQKKANQQFVNQLLASIGLPYGYNITYTPPTADQLKQNKFAVPTPNISADPNWNPFKTPQFQNQYAQEMAREGDIYKKYAPAIKAANMKGTYGSAYNADVLKRNMAQQEAAFNRNYGAEQYANRDAILKYILGVAQGNAQGVGSDASSLANIGQGMQAQEDAAFAQKQQSFAQILGLIKYALQKNKSNAPAYTPPSPALVDFAGSDLGQAVPYLGAFGIGG